MNDLHVFYQREFAAELRRERAVSCLTWAALALAFIAGMFTGCGIWVSNC